MFNRILTYKNLKATFKDSPNAFFPCRSDVTNICGLTSSVLFPVWHCTVLHHRPWALTLTLSLLHVPFSLLHRCDISPCTHCLTQLFCFSLSITPFQSSSFFLWPCDVFSRIRQVFLSWWRWLAMEPTVRCTRSVLPWCFSVPLLGICYTHLSLANKHTFYVLTVCYLTLIEVKL